MASFSKLRTLFQEIRAAVRKFRAAPVLEEEAAHLDSPFTIDPKVLEARLADPEGLAGSLPVLPGHDHTKSPIGKWGPDDPNWSRRQEQLDATRHLEGTGASPSTAPQHQEFARRIGTADERREQGGQQQQQ